MILRCVCERLLWYNYYFSFVCCKSASFIFMRNWYATFFITFLQRSERCGSMGTISREKITIARAFVIFLPHFLCPYFHSVQLSFFMNDSTWFDSFSSHSRRGVWMILCCSIKWSIFYFDLMIWFDLIVDQIRKVIWFDDHIPWFSLRVERCGGTTVGTTISRLYTTYKKGYYN